MQRATRPTARPIPRQAARALYTLRDALAAAGAYGGGNIKFDASVFTTTNTTAQNTIPTSIGGGLTIPANTLITGPTTGSGAAPTNLVTVSGGGSSSNYSIFTVNNGVAGTAIVNLILNNANANWGAIVNEGTLAIIGATISGNTGDSGAASKTWAC